MPENYRDGALYIRVSTDKQEELSPDAQKRLLLDYAKKNKILVNPDYIFIENGISGAQSSEAARISKNDFFSQVHSLTLPGHSCVEI